MGALTMTEVKQVSDDLKVVAHALRDNPKMADIAGLMEWFAARLATIEERCEGRAEVRDGH